MARWVYVHIETCWYNCGSCERYKSMVLIYRISRGTRLGDIGDVDGV